MLSPQFVDSDAFAIAYAWALVLIGAGVPLVFECFGHLAEGRILTGCAIGGVALVVAGVSLWRIGTTLHRSRRDGVAAGVVVD